MQRNHGIEQGSQTISDAMGWGTLRISLGHVCTFPGYRAFEIGRFLHIGAFHEPAAMNCTFSHHSLGATSHVTEIYKIHYSTASSNLSIIINCYRVKRVYPQGITRLFHKRKLIRDSGCPFAIFTNIHPRILQKCKGSTLACERWERNYRHVRTNWSAQH